MSRRKTDRAVREFMALFEETLELSNSIHEREGTHRRNFRGGMVDCLTQIATCADEHYDGWPDDALRTIVLVFAQHAPPDAFKRMLASARRDVIQNRRIDADSVADVKRAG